MILPADGAAVVFLIVRRPDGSPTGYPMTGWFRDGAVEFTTYRKAAKARYLLADDRVCCVMPDRGVVLWGRAELVTSASFPGEPGAPGVAPLEAPAAVRAGVGEAIRTGSRVIFRVRPERTRAVRTVGGTGAEG